MNRETYAVVIRDADGNWQVSRIFETEQKAWGWAKFCESNRWATKVYLGGPGGIQLQRPTPPGC